MRKAWPLLLIAPSLLAFQAKRADFGGNWQLDMEKSVNLPPTFEGVESYVLDIAQSGDSLTVVATMKGKGRTVPFPPYVYVADGRETHRLDSLRGSERWMTARWGRDGASLELDTRVTMKQAGRPALEFTQRDVWKLAPGGTIDVGITQRMKDTDSVRTERRIFRKLK